MEISRSHMRRVLALATVLAAAGAAQPRALRSVQEVERLPNDRANENLPVRFQATVTHYEHKEYNLFMADGAAACYVALDWGKGPIPVKAGDLVEVVGRTRKGGFSIDIEASSVRTIRRGPPPKPVRLPLR